MPENAKLLQVLHITAKIMLVVSLFIALYYGWQYYMYWKGHTASVYEWDVISGEMPQELSIKLAYHEVTRRWIYIGLLFAAIAETIGYFRQPDDHWFSWFLEKARKINNYMEEDK